MTYNTQSADMEEIWETLFLGKTVIINFDTLQQAEAFRVALHKLKNKKEKDLIGIGFMETEELQSLCFHRAPETQYSEFPIYSYRIFLGKRKRGGAQFTITVLD